ncbi:hypothetical protein LTR41_011234, partial [Exophiala xenobiotica]
MDREHQNTRSQVSDFTTRRYSRASSEKVVSLDQSSVATYSTQDPRAANISSNNTPQSNYGFTPSSVRSSEFPPEHLRYSQFFHAPPGPPKSGCSRNNGTTNKSVNNSAGGRAQWQSDRKFPPYSSISHASRTYPPYSLYPQDGNMQHAYQPQHPLYMQQRPPHERRGGYLPQHDMPAPYPHPGPGVQGPPQTSAPSHTGQ